MLSHHQPVLSFTPRFLFSACVLIKLQKKTKTKSHVLGMNHFDRRVNAGSLVKCLGCNNEDVKTVSGPISSIA